MENDSIPTLSGELRPVRRAFLFQRLAPVALIILIASTAAVSAVEWFQPPELTTPQTALIGLAVLVTWLLVGGFWANAAYAKERYEFLDHRIVAHRGTLVSDQTSELSIRNITHVKRRLPWPRYPLFGVGDVMIESAGSDASEITLRTIRHPKKVYEGMAALMRDNGFKLDEEGELLHEEQPDTLAVILECSGMTLAAIFAVMFAMGEFYFNEGGGQMIGLALSLLPLLGVLGIVFHFLDMRRRTYRVYSDKVMYEEGFLTRDDAFIPGENIADSSTRRGLVDQILGLYDVQISCQGSQGEIQFRRLRNGPALSSAVEKVQAAMIGVARNDDTDILTAEVVSAIPESAVTPTTSSQARPPVEPPVAGKMWTTELKPATLRSVAPYLLLCIVAFPLAPLWFAFILQGVIRALCTNYSVRENSVRRRFQFLHSTERDFSYDKITGAVVRENPFDRIFKTVTVTIWSIGSAQPLELEHIEREKLDLPALLRQLGIPEPAIVEEIPSRFSVGRMLWATFPLQIVLALAVIAVVALAVFVDFLFLLILLPLAFLYAAVLQYCRIYYPRCSITLHRNHSECHEGWLSRNHFFARYDNIKRVELTRYPGGDVGTVRLVVAGEHRPAGNAYAKRKKANKPFEAMGANSNGFGIRYAEEISRHAWALDERVSGNDQPTLPTEEPPERESGPALANSLAGLILLSVLVVPLVVLLPVTIPILIKVVRRRRYLIESHRVISRRGIIYRHHASILHDRIDSIRRNQNLIGKIFGNGDVTIFTAGSSSPDLVLKNAPDYVALYDALKTHYTAE